MEQLVGGGVKKLKILRRSRVGQRKKEGSAAAKAKRSTSSHNANHRLQKK